MYSKTHKSICALLVLILSLSLLIGCKNNKSDVIEDTPIKSELESENAHSQFLSFTNDIFMREVTSDSITLHYTVASPSALSIPAQTPSLGHIGEQTRLESIETVSNYLTQLQKLPYEALPKEDQITYDIMKWEFETILSSKDYSYFSESISPTIGIQAQLPILLAEYEFRCSMDIEDYILLLRELPKYYEE